MPIEAYDRHGKIHVRATSRIEAHALMLPPCGAMGCVLRDSDLEAPTNAVEVRVRVRNSNFLSDAPPLPDATDKSAQPGGAKRKRKEGEKEASGEDEFT